MTRKIYGKGGVPIFTIWTTIASLFRRAKGNSNTIGHKISNNSPSAKYTSKFQRCKQIQERQTLNFTSKEYRALQPVIFINSEFNDILHAMNLMTLFPGQTTYIIIYLSSYSKYTFETVYMSNDQVLKHLPDLSLEVSLHISNKSWVTGTWFVERGNYYSSSQAWKRWYFPH